MPTAIHFSPTLSDSAPFSPMHLFYFINGALILSCAVARAAADYSCSEGSAMAGNSDSFHFRGTALGGYMVLEPWLTPSLFYQFLGEDSMKDIGMDSRSFCRALGPKEANRQLKQHWKTWVTEDIIANLAAIGTDTLRIPVGDWMYVPYGEYAECWEGALEELESTIALCSHYNMTVLIDVHCMKGNQNGFDNGGDVEVMWQQNGSDIHFEHWSVREADWVGRYNLSSKTYPQVSLGHLLHSLRVIEAIAVRYQHNFIVIGIEPVNEPWEETPIEILKQFYWDSYLIVQCLSPRMLTLLHDSFRLNLDTWGGFLQGCSNFAFDTHIYQAWAAGGDGEFFVDDACAAGENLRLFEANNIPVVVGEWSLATDNCAMWLNGFNDNLPGYPKVECTMVQCPDPYMGPSQPHAPPDPLKGKQGPFGTGSSTPEYGLCPIDKPFEDDDVVMPRIGMAKMNAFDKDTHGFFFWNFRTELESKWDYQQSVARGWLPSGSQRESAEFAEKLDEICPKAISEIEDQDQDDRQDEVTATGFSLWHVFITVALLLLAWRGYVWCVSAERGGYTAITGTAPGSVGAYEI